jgi:hypothetical protein
LISPKQVAIQNGQIVARTYDVDGEYALSFENKPHSDIPDMIYRYDYLRLLGMVKKYYDAVQWIDAAYYQGYQG